MKGFIVYLSKFVLAMCFIAFAAGSLVIGVQIVMDTPANEMLIDIDKAMGYVMVLFSTAFLASLVGLSLEETE